MGAGSQEHRVQNFDGLGRHVIGEMYGCDPALLADLKAISSAVIRGAKRANATVVGDFANKYEGGGGVSYVLVVKESHISVHTWPEHGYAAVDIYTCGDNVDPWAAFNEILKVLNPKTVSVMEIRRGIVAREGYTDQKVKLAVRE
ncbi:MAG: adenosylmethionine decarboxylase [Thaumarchaeota archaeon]|nr:adenosylmethionine decarboxylase [Candidatus Calditenuaceae archaeon]MDW8042225.1 adenosylmethionine decarboxylase [Nitrososphaerota archaeon]